ncbi:MAG TPA: GAF domain-containing protein, partial [Anaerolineae bacterium]|nr:GAF domain-containing protein [Anaerolineae bacterium]
MKSKSSPKPKSTRSTRPAKPSGPAQADRAVRSRRSKPSAPPIDLTSADKTAKVQAALYEIASAASAVPDMQEFYAAMHRILGELMYAKNFFIALYDEPSGLLSFPYYVDEKDEVQPTQPLVNFLGATGWVMRHGKTISDVDGSYAAAVARGEVKQTGTVGEAGIAVPLRVEDKTIGVVFIQSYTPGIGYQVEDVKILEFVAQHIAQALTRARAIEETRQRNAELQIINSVQEGLASQLDFQAIVDLVGEKVKEIFAADVVGIGLYDPTQKLMSHPYLVDHGERYFPQPTFLSDKLIDYLRTKGAVLIHTFEDSQRLMTEWDISNTGGPTPDNSYIVVPLLLGNRFMGRITIAKLPAHAFTESDVRLLQTLANSMSVALQNARSFEAEKQRAVELALINSVQQGLASQLDVQAIYDLVGDKIQEIFDAQVVVIITFDQATGLSYFPYSIEKGQRQQIEPRAPLGFSAHIVRTRQTLLINHDMAQRSLELDSPVIAGDEIKSYVGVPLLVGAETKGVVSLQNVDRE